MAAKQTNINVFRDRRIKAHLRSESKNRPGPQTVAISESLNCPAPLALVEVGSLLHPERFHDPRRAQFPPVSRRKPASGLNTGQERARLLGWCVGCMVVAVVAE